MTTYKLNEDYYILDQRSKGRTPKNLMSSRSLDFGLILMLKK